MPTNEEGQEPEQVEYESDHEPRLWPDRTNRSMTCQSDGVLAKDRRWDAVWLAESCGYIRRSTWLRSTATETTLPSPHLGL
jgi:hypothetical protein